MTASPKPSAALSGTTFFCAALALFIRVLMGIYFIKAVLNFGHGLKYKGNKNMVLLIQEDFVLFNIQIHNPNVINREYYLVRLLITKTKFVPTLKSVWAQGIASQHSPGYLPILCRQH